MNALTAATAARVGLRIKQARKQAGFSHDQLAARAGTSRQHLIKLEKGQHLPGPVMLAAIADATGKSVDYFTADGDDDEEADVEAALMRALRAWVRAEL